MNAWLSHFVIGVADLSVAEKLWVGRFGLDVVARRTGSDTALGQFWGLADAQFVAQALVRTPGTRAGGLHFVQFADPGATVRAGAGATDLGPKNIDVYAADMDARVAELTADGYTFRSAIGDYEMDGLSVREVQMPAHDDTNIVLVEVLNDDYPRVLSPAGYSAITSMVIVVADTQADGEFYQSLFGLEETMHHRITGPAIEAIVGLPPGSALDMRLLGHRGDALGTIELIGYEGLDGVNRFPRTPPPALGALHAAIAVDSFEEFLTRADTLGIAVDSFGTLDTVFGAVTAASIRSPGGLRIDVISPPDR